jgi:hypothetical protein
MMGFHAERVGEMEKLGSMVDSGRGRMFRLRRSWRQGNCVERR